MALNIHTLITNMSTLSVPLSPDLESFISDMVQRGVAQNKAEVVRQALTHYKEDQALAAVLKAEQEVQEGKVLRGDLDDLASRI